MRIVSPAVRRRTAASFCGTPWLAAALSGNLFRPEHLCYDDLEFLRFSSGMRRSRSGPKSWRWRKTYPCNGRYAAAAPAFRGTLNAGIRDRASNVARLAGFRETETRNLTGLESSDHPEGEGSRPLTLQNSEPRVRFRIFAWIRMI